MKFKLSFSLLLTLALAVVLHAADSPLPAAKPNPTKTATNAPVSKATNSAAAATNAAASNNSAIEAPKIPDDHFTNTVGMEFVKVGDFWAGKYEVTQKDYQEIMGSNPSEFQGNLRPVDNVSWEDAMEFCKRLTQHEAKELPEGFTYTLPTEGQWDSMVGDASLENAVTSQVNSRDGTSPVGSLGPNNLGLYDIRGNVWEFCLESSKPYRILKGGSWQDRIDINLRTVFRYYARPDEHKNIFGFRCILLPHPPG
ncbi:MAG TPA: SUMF1/EgtB/PvdO family nonheme iron enzyme [Verrucomicrobiae bacterium]|nr:SUMF1/EgtB/PvdO family nonheme iron enzyme [Verrucomicrobiae bacterium]